MLRPSNEANEIFLYCLAYAAKHTGVEVHAFVQMSNHWHGLVTDTYARLPEFLQLMHRLIACAMNAALGRVENFWSNEHTSVVRLDDPDDVFDKLAYVIVNPVAAGLVEAAKDWPGMITTGLSEVHVANRPARFFRAEGHMPERLTLACTVPLALRDLDRDDAAKRLRRLVRERAQREASTLRQQGKSFLGADAVLATPTSMCATTPEASRKRRPTFASHDRARRLAAHARLRDFRLAHTRAFDAWRNGDRRVCFPDGTYLMRVRHGAVCGPPPSS